MRWPGEMRIRKLTEQAEIARIYDEKMKQDFPPNELKPFSSILRAWEGRKYYCYVLETDVEILGYAYFARNGCSYLLDYLAIAGEHRDQGLGTVFLSQLADCFQATDCILVEAEDPDAAQNQQNAELRERRLNFYRKCGYRLTDVKTSVFGADYRRERRTPRKKQRKSMRKYTEQYCRIGFTGASSGSGVPIPESGKR